MNTPLRVLCVENPDEDSEQILLELRRGDFEPDVERIETREELAIALQDDRWQLILCDYSLPDFDGLAALKIVRDKNPDIPFILLSDAPSEDIAVKAIKAGAQDYLPKNNLQRLVPAVKRELKHAQHIKQYKKNEEEKKRLLETVEQSPNEIYLFDGQTLKFEYVNQVALSNLGYSESEIKQLSLLDILPDFDEEDFRKLLKPLENAEKEKVVFSSNHKPKSGPVYPVQTHLRVIRQNGGLFFSAIVLDRTGHETESPLLANISHELRTPINSINLLSRLLIRKTNGKLEQEELEYLNLIQRSGNNLLNLVDNILDHFRTEAGKMSLHIEQTDLYDSCNYLEKLFLPIAQEKGIHFSVKIQKEVARTIYTDRLRLEQILKNLLSNACKFTHEGSVELTVYPPGEDEKRDLGIATDPLIAFRVSDTGIGISKSKQDLIFEAFQQSGGTTRKNYGGTGLGLSISREMADLLGGEITLQSEKGGGSKFTLYLGVDPRDDTKEPDFPADDRSKTARKPELEPTSENRSTSSEGPQNGSENVKQILLADDSDIHVSALKELLETDSVKCLTAGSATETFRLLDSSTPDCVVLDLHLPDANGFEMLETIRKHDHEFRQIPIIIYTGKSLSQHEKQYLRERADAVIVKTNDSFKKLEAEIDNILHLNKS